MNQIKLEPEDSTFDENFNKCEYKKKIQISDTGVPYRNIELLQGTCFSWSVLQWKPKNLINNSTGTLQPRAAETPPLSPIQLTFNQLLKMDPSVNKRG
jgi:hypothetical protein